MSGLFKPSSSSTSQNTFLNSDTIGTSNTNSNQSGTNGQVQNQSSVSSVNPYSDTAMNYLGSGFNTINNNLGQTGAGYTGNLSAGWTSGQENALNTAKSYLDSNSLTSKVAKGDYLDIANNPTYQQAVKDLQDQFGTNVDSLNTKFSPWVSSSMRNNAASDLAQSFSEGLGSAWANQYNTEMNRALDAQNTLSGYNQNLASLEANKQNTQQSALDSAYQEWVRQQGTGDTNTSNWLQMANLLQSPITTNTGTSTLDAWSKMLEEATTNTTQNTKSNTNADSKTTQKSSFLGK